MRRCLPARLATLAALLVTPTSAPAQPEAGGATPIDVPHRRIEQRGYTAATALQVGETGGAFRVEVGAAIHASAIVVEIHQAHGTYRFLADGSDLDRALARQEAITRRTDR